MPWTSAAAVAAAGVAVAAVEAAPILNQTDCATGAAAGRSEACEAAAAQALGLT